MTLYSVEVTRVATFLVLADDREEAEDAAANLADDPDVWEDHDEDVYVWTSRDTLPDDEFVWVGGPTGDWRLGKELKDG